MHGKGINVHRRSMYLDRQSYREHYFLKPACDIGSSFHPHKNASAYSTLQLGLYTSPDTVNTESKGRTPSRWSRFKMPQEARQHVINDGDLAMDRYDGGIFVITMRRAPENRLNSKFAQKLIGAFNQARELLGTSSEGAVITKGNDAKFWCTVCIPLFSHV